ncbi:MAG TPA: cytochrome c oxidase assembly protein [Acidimicrobiales bacterium]|nr:cytochrome c oxidase assembly protein [Acidimicrobiales bacterium]
MTSLLPPTWHPALLAALVVATGVYLVATRRGELAANRSELRRFAAAVLLAYLVCSWPLGDLAAHVSITAVVVQRLVLMLAVAPLLLSSLPDALIARLTRRHTVDRVMHAVVHPAIAIAVVTVIGTVTLVPAVISWGSSSVLAGGLFIAVTLGLGLVLWMPILGSIPGLPRLSYTAKGGYLLAASLVVTSLSFVWIFARHPMYGSLSHQTRILGISPLLDQQLAGFVSKLGAYFPMWAIAFVLFARAGDGGESDQPDLRWIDVQRELERVDRSAITDRDAGAD